MVLLDTIDYIFVINGHKCNIEIPDKSNIKIIKRDNIGYDFGGHKAALESLIKILQVLFLYE